MILIVNQGNTPSSELQHCLQRVNADCALATSMATALHKCTHEFVPVIVLALSQPLVECLDDFRALVRKAVNSAVIVLAQQGCEAERILSLELGAHDYLDYPCNPAELQARVRVQLRRTPASSSPDNDRPIQIGCFRIDHNYHHATVNGYALPLTATEFDLLYFLASHPDQVFSRAQLLSSVWGYHYSGYEHTVNSHVNHLRAKLDKAPLHSKLVETVWGVGYKFNSASVLPTEMALPYSA